MLIYGTKDMKKKLFERENRQKNKSKRPGINVSDQRKVST